MSCNDVHNNQYTKPDRISYLSTGGTFLIYDPPETTYWLSDKGTGIRSIENDVGGPVEPCGSSDFKCLKISEIPLSVPVNGCVSNWSFRGYDFRTVGHCSAEKSKYQVLLDGEVLGRYDFRTGVGVTEFQLLPRSDNSKTYTLASNVGFLG